MARSVIVIGSGVGVKVAVNRKHRNIARRHGFKIALPEITPNKLSATKNNGNTKAMPKIKMSLNTKSKYSSNLTRLPKLFGVKPSKTSTA